MTLPVQGATLGEEDLQRLWTLVREMSDRCREQLTQLLYRSVGYVPRTITDMCLQIVEAVNVYPLFRPLTDEEIEEIDKAVRGGASDVYVSLLRLVARTIEQWSRKLTEWLETVETDTLEITAGDGKLKLTVRPSGRYVMVMDIDLAVSVLGGRYFAFRYARPSTVMYVLGEATLVVAENSIYYPGVGLVALNVATRLVCNPDLSGRVTESPLIEQAVKRGLESVMFSDWARQLDERGLLLYLTTLNMYVRAVDCSLVPSLRDIAPALVHAIEEEVNMWKRAGVDIYKTIFARYSIDTLFSVFMEEQEIVALSLFSLLTYFMSLLVNLKRRPITVAEYGGKS